jgi:osmotically-inducible protein OsmY
MATSVDILLCDRIERAIKRGHRLSSQRIDVHVNAGRARLDGTDQFYRRKLAALQIATGFEGCRDVVDELEVQPVLEPDPEVAHAVRASLDACADLTKETIAVTARNGMVTLTGHVAVPWERTLAQDIALGMRGVREVANQVIVDCPSQERDEALAKDLGKTLRHTRRLADTKIHVAVNSAAVVLSGKVATLWQKEMAESVAGRYMPCLLRNEITMGD